MTEKPITTVDELLAAIAAARATGDTATAQGNVNLEASWAIDANLDQEFAHDGIYWDAATEVEIEEADAVARQARADLDKLLTDPAIEAQYREDLQGQHYQSLRAERTREPALSDEDEYA